MSTNSTPFIIGMRDSYFDELFEIFKKDHNAVFVSADNGSPRLDQFASDLPDQYFTVGIAEEEMMGLAAGLAVEGRKVYTYAIMPFVSLRIAEFVKLDQCAMNANIVNIGVGSGFSYDIMSVTHHTLEDLALMRAMPNLTIYAPSDANMSAQMAQLIHDYNTPVYLKLDRAGIPDLYAGKKLNLEQGLFSLGTIDDLMPDVFILSTGRFVYQAKQVAEELFKPDSDSHTQIVAEVIDVFRLKPFNLEELRRILISDIPIVTYEEHYLNGGLGSIVLEALNGVEPRLHSQHLPILRIGVDDRFSFEMGGRAVLHELNGLDIATVAKRIETWVKG